ncbi:hypothetical protein SARC_07109 [Sphaeroforma arctica JP610]|uniref:Serine/threonine-protein phosphatase PGAM5, mitochondrial n=1 Tax=Sphaeroforma arctica JP610 TaxID=667725 RepID=A0A0L0FUM9_9EUKA|nr:hypothetical protein SARC_07109 [Sphaeroforma arctica JP610]KNC80537.1 hypothetical protein SARC_07109 [Sphaeroforma arctica JP610]|eukprot:XP_014154439.1 hypothetical protein SARC_07109 [Sphaeroforma arctica JP610]
MLRRRVAAIIGTAAVAVLGIAEIAALRSAKNKIDPNEPETLNTNVKNTNDKASEKTDKLPPKQYKTPQTYNVQWDNNWDKRGDTPPVKDIQMSKRSIYLIRHGQYEKADDDKDRHLTALGRLQAASVGKRLNELPFVFDEVYVSNMTRALETCEIIYDQHNIAQKARSETEVLVTAWPEKSVCTMLREGAPDIPLTSGARWRPTAADFYQDGARIEAAYRKFFRRPDTSEIDDRQILIVCHANVIRYFAMRAMQFPPELWSKFSLINCSISKVDIYADGRVQLTGMGDAGHHTPEMLTTS